MELRCAIELHFSKLHPRLALLLYTRAQSQALDSMQSCTTKDWGEACRQLDQNIDIHRARHSFERWTKKLQQQESRVSEALRFCPAEEVLLYDDPSFPSCFQRLSKPPFLLFLRGRRAALLGSGYACCGSRLASLSGQKQAFSLGLQISRLTDYNLISGLSEGIETAALEGALASQQQRHGKPINLIAVLSSGLDAINPASARLLAARILKEGGLLISPYPHQQPRQQFSFLPRNEIQMSLASSLIMVEIGIKSKAYNLVDFALQQNHDVAALGDSPGVRKLIAQGCPHWEDAESLLRALGLAAPKSSILNASPDSLHHLSCAELLPLISQQMRAEICEEAIRYRDQLFTL